MTHYYFFLQFELKRASLLTLILLVTPILTIALGIGFMTLIRDYDLQVTLNAVNFPSLLFIPLALIIARLWYCVLLAADKTKLFRQYTDRPPLPKWTVGLILWLPYSIAVFAIFSLWVALGKPTYITGFKVPLGVYIALFLAGGYAILLRYRAEPRE